MMTEKQIKQKQKAAKRFAGMFARAMKKAGYGQPDWCKRYEARYMEYVTSPKYEHFSQYKTMSLDKVFAAVTHAKLCEESGVSLDEANEIWERHMAVNVRRLLKGACWVFDLLPNGYRIVAGWLYDDAKARIAEGCLSYERLDYSDEKLEYSIMRCAYVELFAHYGIKRFCKVFCENDLCMQVMHRRAEYVRYDDLVDGNCCHDALINQRPDKKRGQKQKEEDK